MENLLSDPTECLPPCDGILVTSFIKTENLNEAEVVTPELLMQYNKYKQFVSFPREIAGIDACNYFNIYALTFNDISFIFSLDFQWKNKLRVVRIFFDTPVFDKITKDRAAKFVDMLSAIGGTMGLLTGFSIISGVEILYFSAKIVWNLSKKK